MRKFTLASFSILLVTLLFSPVFCSAVRAQQETPTVSPSEAPVTLEGIVSFFNARRNHNNMRPLIQDPILMGLAQQTADIMAVNEMSWHIGGVRERAIFAGYGAGDIPWLTENFAIGPMSLEQLTASWSDEDHMRPANNQYYAHYGFATSEYNGDVYYVFIAGYTSNRIYKPGATALPGQTLTAPVSQIMFPVTLATPAADGRIIHTVKHGQTLWAIAIAYGTHILDIQRANGMTADQVDLYEGQKLVIPISGKTDPGATPAASPTKTIARQTAVETITAQIQKEQTSTPEPVSKPAFSGEFIIVLAAVLAAVGLIGFGMFIGRKDPD